MPRNKTQLTAIDAGASADIGSVADAAVTDPTASASMIAALKGVIKQLQGSGSGAVPPGNTTTTTATIASAASLSDEINISGYAHMAIMMPASWTAADITFQASNESGGTFYDLYGIDGVEINITAEAQRVITIDVHSSALAPLSYLKIRSGTAGTPVAQAAERILTIILKS